MAYVTKEFVLQKIQDSNLKYWKVEAPGQTHFIDQQRADISLTESISKLENLLMTLTGGYITITASPSDWSGRGGDKSQLQQFKVMLDTKATPINGAAAPSLDTSLLDRIKALEVALIEQKYNQLLEAKNREIAELKEGTTTDKLINGLLPIMAAKFGGVSMAPAPGIAGTEATPGERIKASLVKLNAIDKDLPGTMEALAKFAEQNPDQYTSYLTMLKSQVN